MSSRNSATLDAYVGGFGKRLSVLGAASGAVAWVYADVPAEIGSVELAPGVCPLALGAAHTVASLLAAAGAPESARSIFRTRPGVALESGLAGFRALGGFAADVRLADDDVQALMASLVDRARVARFGQVDELRVRVFHSAAGATGSGASLPLAAALTRAGLDRTAGTVRVDLFVLGTAAYIALMASRAEINAGAHVAELLPWAAGEGQDPREVRSATLFELPPGLSVADREQRGAQLIEAISSTGVSEALDRVGTNAALSSPVGNITLLSSWFIAGAAPLVDAAGWHYAGEIELALRESAPIVAEGVTITLDEEPCPASPLPQQLADIRTSKGVSPPDLARLAAAPDRRIDSGAVTVKLSGTPLVITGASTLFEAATDLPTLRNKLSRLRTIRTMLEREEGSAAGRNAERDAAARIAVAELDRELRSLFGRGWWARLTRALRAPDSLIQRYATASAQARAASLERLRAETRLDLLRQAATRVAHEIQFEETRFRRLAASLKAICAGHARPGLVEPTPIARLLPLLLTAPAGSEALRTLLARSIGSLTLRGLAALVGAPDDARPESILSTIAARERSGSVQMAPSWGGRSVLANQESFIVLPPLSPGARAGLARAAENSAQPAPIVFSDTCVAGPAVVGVHAYRPREIRDILPAILAKGCEAALAEAPAFFRDSTEAVLSRIVSRVAPIVRCPQLAARGHGAQSPRSDPQ